MAEEEEEWWPEPEGPEVPLIVPEAETVDREILGHLYGPDGEPLLTLVDRPWVPFGFQNPREVR